MFILLGNIYNNNNLTESRVYILDAHSCMNEAQQQLNGILDTEKNEENHTVPW